jgi:hypothetical protein
MIAPRSVAIQTVVVSVVAIVPPTSRAYTSQNKEMLSVDAVHSSPRRAHRIVDRARYSRSTAS